MPVKLHTTKPPGTIHVSEMKDGDLAVIVEWGDGYDRFVGRVIQRHGNVIITVGMRRGERWNPIPTKKISPECIVRLLQPGELIEVTK